ncbi:MAG: hypothetical protein K6A43_02995, partial [Treponema sp.]|nr:hypothetical protein [Treponema sp.]
MVKGTTNTDKGQRSEKLPPIIHNVARRKLRMIAAAKEINIPQTRISEIIHGNRSITADTRSNPLRYNQLLMWTLALGCLGEKMKKYL